MKITYKIELNTLDGRYCLELDGTYLRLIDWKLSRECNNLKYNEIYRINQLGIFDGYLINFSDKFAYILGNCKTLQEVKKYIQYKFLLE